MYFLSYGAQKHGPFSVDQIKSMVASGTVPADALYWDGSKDRWHPLAKLLGTDPPPPTTETTVDELAPHPWRRFWARILDGHFLGGVPLIITMPLWKCVLPPGLLFPGGIAMAFAIALETSFISRLGTTPGKWLLGISVCTAEGGRLPVDRAQRRTLAAAMRAIPLLLPFCGVLAYRDLMRSGRTKWDRTVNSIVKCEPLGMGGTARWAVAFAFLAMFGVAAVSGLDSLVSINEQPVSDIPRSLLIRGAELIGFCIPLFTFAWVTGGLLRLITGKCMPRSVALFIGVGIWTVLFGLVATHPFESPASPSANAQVSSVAPTPISSSELSGKSVSQRIEEERQRLLAMSNAPTGADNQTSTEALRAEPSANNSIPLGDDEQKSLRAKEAAAKGYAALKEERFDDAETAYLIAITNSFRDVTSWYNLGYIYGKQGKTAEEIDTYRHVLRLDRNYTEAWYALAVTYWQLDRVAEAGEAISALKEQAPERARTLIRAMGSDFAQKLAVWRYPSLADPDSRVNKEFLRRYAMRRRDTPRFFDDADWPLTLAEESAEAPAR